MSARIMLDAGARFGRLVVVREDGRHRKEIAWLCRCDCGTPVRVASFSLRSGTTRSCGCLYRDAIAERTRTHGLTGLPEFDVWRSMMRRCYDPRAKQFHDYGGRGISVCERWHTPGNFVADMAPRPEGAQIDRKDNDGNYEPGNCRWATRAQQMANRRVVSRYRTLDGDRMPIKAMACVLAIPVSTLRHRLHID